MRSERREGWKAGKEMQMKPPSANIPLGIPVVTYPPAGRA